MTGVLPAEPHIELVRCQVHYMGRRAPADVPDGLMAIQRPLLELFHSVGISGSQNAVLTVYTSGVLAESPELAPGDKWWPIQDLLECGAFKVVGSDVIPVEVVEPKRNKSNSHGPALFAMAFHRQDIPAADTWGFVTPSDETSMDFVVAIRMAYENRAGWGSSRSDRPPPVASSQSSSAKQIVSPGSSSDSSMFHATAAGGGGGGGGKSRSGYSERGGAMVRNGLLDDRHVLKAYYDKPPLNGYFYTPSSSLIQKYSVSEKQTEVVQMPLPPQQTQNPEEICRETDLILVQPPYGPADYDQQFSGDNYPFAYGVPPPQTTGYLVPQRPLPKDEAVDKNKNGKKDKRKKKKKKGKKKQSGSSDEDEETSSVAVFTRDNGERVVVVPENISIVVRPPSNTAPGPFNPQGAIGQDGTGNVYLDSSNPHYERRIVPGGFGRPEIDLDPFTDEGPYERRLPVGGYGVEPGFYKPNSRNPGPRNFTGQPQDVPEQFSVQGPQGRRLPVGGYGVEPGFNPGLRNFTAQPRDFQEPWLMADGPITESNFLLRPSDLYGRAPPLVL